MLITTISIIISAVVGFILYKRDLFDDCRGSAIIIILVFGSLIAVVAHLVTYPFCIDHQYTSTKKEIVAMKTDARVEGDVRGGLFYIKGTIDEKDYYIVLTKTDHVYKQDKVPVENTVIIETADTPNVIKTKHYTGSAWPNKIRFHEQPEYVDEKDTIYVPFGTVSEERNFDVF